MQSIENSATEVIDIDDESSIILVKDNLLLLVGLGLVALIAKEKFDRKSMIEDLDALNERLANYLKLRIPQS